MEIQVFIGRLMLALLGGAIIGFERQWNHKSAGLRTNTLVSIGAAIYVLLSIQLTVEDGDVTRIIGQVVTGIGFLGAGIILHKGTDIQGLTTAATIWCSSAVGCLAGAGYVAETFICAITIVLINEVLYKVDLFVENRNKNNEP